MDRHDFMRACSDGGPRIAEALRMLQRDYGRALLHEAMCALGELQAARDLVQDTLIRAWQRCAQYRGESELFPWLKTVLRHRAADELRRRRPESPLDDAQGRVLAEVEAALQRAAPVATPEQQWRDAELEALYRACAQRFRRDHPAAAEVLRWIAEDELSPAEIATLLGRSPGATREYLSQCRKKARVYFHDWYLQAGLRAGETRSDTTASADERRPAVPKTLDPPRGDRRVAP
ncbi:RNA polymerase sigma factor [Aquabacterium humicola]|uniref:RNA polymerase sigma factor n=1 Tax=Aquabacterium humicola TaxID=3237377 RepID=UPI002543DB17|nr:sigma-70 family RNA polymerase sigma factor [Rubrivivax pictus]